MRVLSSLDDAIGMLRAARSLRLMTEKKLTKENLLRAADGNLLRTGRHAAQRAAGQSPTQRREVSIVVNKYGVRSSILRRWSATHRLMSPTLAKKISAAERRLVLIDHTCRS